MFLLTRTFNMQKSCDNIYQKEQTNEIINVKDKNTTKDINDAKDENIKNISDIICPITLEPIEQFGFTILGSYYEYDKICEWLVSHNTDPVTNIYLPVKKITKFNPKSIDDLEKYKSQKQQFTLLWCPLLKYTDLTQKNVKLYNFITTYYILISIFVL